MKHITKIANSLEAKFEAELTELTERMKAPGVSSEEQMEIRHKLSMLEGMISTELQSCSLLHRAKALFGGKLL